MVSSGESTAMQQKIPVDPNRRIRVLVLVVIRALSPTISLMDIAPRGELLLPDRRGFLARTSSLFLVEPPRPLCEALGRTALW